MGRQLVLCLAVLAALAAPAGAEEQPALIEFKVLSPSAALKVAQAALESCRKSGYQVAVSVVDRSGTPQVLLRDRFAGAHTPETARRKAWTAVSFRSDTLELASISQAGEAQSGVRFVSDALMIGGGVRIEAAGSTVGGVGVSGAPGGEADDACARAGIEAIEEEISF